MNPLLRRDTLPCFEQINTTHISPAINKIIHENKKIIKEIELDNEEPNWSNFVSRLEKCDEKLSRVWSQIVHLNSVMNNNKLRNTYNKNLTKITTYYSELGQNESIYQKFKQLNNKIDQFNKIQQKIIKDEILGFKLGGVGLPKIKKREYKEIKNELSKLSSKFEEDLLDSINQYNLLISDNEKIKGIPEDILNNAKNKARAAKKQGWLFTLDFPSYVPVQQYADDRQLRKDLYHAYSVKASELGDLKFDNTKVIQQIIKLKANLAHLLGYKNYAEMALQTRMANTSAEVITFLLDLANKSKSFAKKDMDDLKKIGKTFGINNVEAWDIAYLSEKLKNHKFNFSENDIKQYFPDNKILEGLFKVAKKIYGLKFQQIKAEIWHADVRFFEIKDQFNKTIGQFYLDLYARKNKRSGAWMDEAISKYNFDNDSALPVAFLTCNFTPPLKGQPSLLKHDEVITLFHEFGHGLHHLLTEINEYTVSGIKGVEWDAVELPSQFMENFCWEWSVIKDMSEHIETKKSMPKSLFTKLLKSKNFQSGMQTLRQIEFSLFDIKLHSEFDARNDNFMNLLERVRDDIAVIRPPKWNRFPHSFSHIFAGGYAAGYYSYKWAEVLSADAYSKFEEIGVLSKEAGDQFRKEILSKGGSRPALESFIAFRGREPSINPLLKHLGLKD
ncbi:MAG: M3 family metallopeptidase [Methylophilaceae bacterium]